jgi:ribonuclease HI
MALTMNYKRVKHIGPGPIVRHGWIKPPEDRVKVNVDASFDVNMGSGASSAIIRDHLGTVISCGHWKINSVEDAATAEACALRHGLLLAGEVGCSNLLVESDCSEVVEVMQNGGNSLGAAAAIYEECTFLCRGFSRVSFAHCPREANRAAHELSKFNEVDHVVWHGDPPSYLRAVIANDITLISN